jgi:hypothetical protein
LKRIEQTKVKHTHRGYRLRHPFEGQLKFNYKNQVSEIGTMCAGEEGLLGRGRVN